MRYRENHGERKARRHPDCRAHNGGPSSPFSNAASRSGGRRDVRKGTGGPAKPTPRTPDGHPDLNGYWKGLRTTKPVGNIGKDLPGFKLPFTPEGEAAWKHNVTATYDPEALCIPGGIPRHNASGLPFMVMQTPKLVAYVFLQLSPSDSRRRPEAFRRPRPVVLRRGDRALGGRHAGDRFHRSRGDLPCSRR